MHQKFLLNHVIMKNVFGEGIENVHTIPVAISSSNITENTTTFF
jgi:hypothetical protein